ncbi:thymidylate synthase [Candidatus Woesearchaeota archaeon]|nr:thymidylate synthase [Candidatus Woesearchaeota archaeon]
MKQYLDLVDRILKEGELKENRTGVKTYSISGTIFEHDMHNGFPLITTKKVAVHAIKVELEGFIKGITDKKWFQDRKCNIWNEWCNPEKVPYGHDKETKIKMMEERDLGPIYGWQWRHFGAEYQGIKNEEDNAELPDVKCRSDVDSNQVPLNASLANMFEKESYKNKGIDQLEILVKKLKANPDDRRMIVSAWNPEDLDKMALPPCHMSYQVTVTNGKLNLMWNQRSVDTMLGLPFNIASYGILLHLLAKEARLKEGRLVGFLGDTHIYENHIEGAREQLNREPYYLPILETEKFTSLFDWTYQDTKFVNYEHHPKIKFDVVV